ncbi:MAG: biopolymer transporter ExbD [Thioclava marina]|uniref:ExbD/TolR family protein n=1 Tax=Thioclava marina TaxID=1915077 RepID=UPI0019BF0CDC|nr:biopolymer transporter ExbD [Thioclava marina]MBC7145916.1 biopolymer transporter ExbD [Thioclava marina]
MEFPHPRRSGNDANLLPMINVVFLLLIFFLISAQLAPPEPFPVTLPSARDQEQQTADFTLYLDASGQLAYLEGTSREAANDAPLIAALQSARASYCAAHDCDAPPPRLFLRADSEAPVARIAGLLPALGQAGFTQTDLVVQSEAVE